MFKLIYDVVIYYVGLLLTLAYTDPSLHNKRAHHLSNDKNTIMIYHGYLIQINNI